MKEEVIHAEPLLQSVVITSFHDQRVKYFLY